MFRIGIIGCGGIARGAHLPGYEKAAGARVIAACDVDGAALNTVSDRLGLPSDMRFSDYRDLVARADIDAVDVCTPNDSHVEIAMAAARAGKPFLVEKPVATNARDAEALLRAARDAGVASMVCFSYRYLPATRYAKSLVERGFPGRIHSVYATYLKDSAFIPGRRLEWRFEKSRARYGVSGDLGVHLLDAVTWLAGDVTGLIARTSISVPARPRLESDETAPVDTDDSCTLLAELSGGATATLGVSRAASGNGNRIRLELYGDKGGLRFDLNEPDKLELADGQSPMRTAKVPDEYRASQQQSFIDLLNGIPDPCRPTLEDGARLQRVLDAILASDKSRGWVSL